MPDRRLRVLPVEDDTFVRLTAAMMLEDRGLAVVEAATGEEAWRLVEGGLSVDVPVTDIDLGAGVDGLALAERVRALRPAPPVVFVTGRITALRDRPRRVGRLTWPNRSTATLWPVWSAARRPEHDGGAGAIRDGAARMPGGRVKSPRGGRHRREADVAFGAELGRRTGGTVLLRGAHSKAEPREILEAGATRWSGT